MFAAPLHLHSLPRHLCLGHWLWLIVFFILTIATPAPALTLRAHFCGEEPSAVDARQIREWEALHPDHKVVLNVIPWATCQQNLFARALIGERPNLAYVGARDVARINYVHKLARIPIQNPHRYRPEAIKLFALDDGNFLAIPRAMSAKALFWNKEIFRESGLDPETAPKTVEQMIEFAKKIVAKTGEAGFCLVGSDTSNNTTHQFLNFYFSLGGDFEPNDDGKLVDEAVFLDTLALYRALRPYAEADYLETSREECYELFKRGRVAMTVQGPWALSLGPEFGHAAIPGGNGFPGRSLIIADALINLSTRNAEIKATNSLIEYMTNNENQRQFDAQGGFISVLADDPENQLDPVFKEALTTGHSEPIGVDAARAQNTIRKIVTHEFHGYRNHFQLLRRLQNSLALSRRFQIK